MILNCTGADKALTWSSATQSWGCNTIVGGVPVWGAIIGTLSAQLDLQSALDGKEPAGTLQRGSYCVFY